jgi:hypothetical protein
MRQNLKLGEKLGVVNGVYEMRLTHGRRAAAPNAQKLSDVRSRRAGCRKVRGFEAASVTAERVRCSAWLGDVGFGLVVE